MAIITEQIPAQGFEIVLNKIALIIFEEIVNQEQIQNLDSTSEVYIERQEPYDKSEDVIINVSCSNANYTGNKKDSQGNTIYHIDVYCRSFNQEVSGSYDSRLKLHRYVGMIRYILSSSKYHALDLPNGLIGGKYIDSISFDDNYGNQDGAYIRFARLIFSVRIQEYQNLWDSVPLLGNDTTVKIDLTNLGFKLINT